MSKIYEEILNAVVELDEDNAIELANTAIKDEIDVLEVIEKGYSAGIQKIGVLWEEGEIFLPELIMGANIVEAALKLLLPHLKEGQKSKKHGKIIIATIEGDVHSIGKNIVGTMLNAYGFEVIDLGAEVPADKIVDEAVKNEADVIAVSALLTTTMPGQKRVIELLKERHIREKFKVIFGGAPVTRDWTKSVGADGYASNATDAVAEVKKLLGL